MHQRDAAAAEGSQISSGSGGVKQRRGGANSKGNFVLFNSDKFTKLVLWRIKFPPTFPPQACSQDSPRLRHRLDLPSSSAVRCNCSCFVVVCRNHDLFCCGSSSATSPPSAGTDCCRGAVHPLEANQSLPLLVLGS